MHRNVHGGYPRAGTWRRPGRGRATGGRAGPLNAFRMRTVVWLIKGKKENTTEGTLKNQRAATARPCTVEEKILRSKEHEHARTHAPAMRRTGGTHPPGRGGTTG